MIIWDHLTERMAVRAPLTLALLNLILGHHHPLFPLPTTSGSWKRPCLFTPLNLCPKDSLYLKGRPFAKAPPLWSHFRVLTSSCAFLARPQHLPEEAELSTYVCMDSETLARGGGLVGVSVLSQGDAGHTVRRVNTNRILTNQVSLSNITSSGRPSWITPSVLQWSSNFSLHQKDRRGL